MPDTEKIWAWCDRHQNLTGIPHALLVFKTSRVSFFEPYNIPIWIAVAQECREYWVCIQDAEGSTPEEAIAKLAEVCYTGGNTMPFDPWELCEDTYSRFRSWAGERDADLLRCDHCGEVVNEKYTLHHYPDFVFCREYCAEEFLAQKEEDLEKEFEYA